MDQDAADTSSVDFEALIDLLATDGVDDDNDNDTDTNPFAPPKPKPAQRQTQDVTAMRRADGSLDYGRIREYFEGRSEVVEPQPLQPAPGPSWRPPSAPPAPISTTTIAKAKETETPVRRTKKPPMPMSLPTPNFSMTGAITSTNPTNTKARTAVVSSPTPMSSSMRGSTKGHTRNISIPSTPSTPTRTMTGTAPLPLTMLQRSTTPDGAPPRPSAPLARTQSEPIQQHVREQPESGRGGGQISISPLSLPPSRSLAPVDDTSPPLLPASTLLLPEPMDNFALPPTEEDIHPQLYQQAQPEPRSRPHSRLSTRPPIQTNTRPDPRPRPRRPSPPHSTLSPPPSNPPPASYFSPPQPPIATIQSQNELIATLRQGLESNREQTAQLDRALRNVRAEADTLRKRCAELRMLAEGMGWGAEEEGTGMGRRSGKRPESRLGSYQHRDYNTAGTQTAPSPTNTDDDPTITQAYPNPSSKSRSKPRQKMPMVVSTATTNLSTTRSGRSSPPMDEVELMSGTEARRTLRDVLTSLSILPNHTDEPIQTHIDTRVDDVRRSLGVVQTLDELVWKGSARRRRDDGEVYGEENVKAVVERVRLWERAVRRPITFSGRGSNGVAEGSRRK